MWKTTPGIPHKLRENEMQGTLDAEKVLGLDCFVVFGNNARWGKIPRDRTVKTRHCKRIKAELSEQYRKQKITHERATYASTQAQKLRCLDGTGGSEMESRSWLT